MSAPSLVNLSLENVHVLRAHKLAELKNTLMMTVLNESDWYTAYRDSLASFRAGRSAQPAYPVERVEAVEALVDTLIRASVDPTYTR